MRVSNVNCSNKSNVNFSSLTIHMGFYDKAIDLLHNAKTKDVFEKTYKTLENASKNRTLELRAFGDSGAAVAELDSKGDVIRYVSKNFNSALESLKDAVAVLSDENAPKEIEKKRKFLWFKF